MLFLIFGHFIYTFLYKKGVHLPHINFQITRLRQGVSRRDFSGCIKTTHNIREEIFSELKSPIS